MTDDKIKTILRQARQYQRDLTTERERLQKSLLQLRTETKRRQEAIAAARAAIDADTAAISNNHSQEEQAQRRLLEINNNLLELQRDLENVEII